MAHSILFLIAIGRLFLVSFSNAWEIDDRCLRRRNLWNNETSNFLENDEETLLIKASNNTVSVVNELYPPEEIDKNFSRDSIGNGVGTLENLLFDRRELQDTESFHLKLYWYEGACWQEEWRERKWCMQCHGSRCSRGDILWIQVCNRDIPEQRFQWIPTYGDRFQGRLKTASSNFCLQKVGSRSFELQVCNINSRSQLLVRSTVDDIFQLHPESAENKCLTQHHHPKPKEDIYAVSCSEASAHRTSKWEIYWPGTISGKGRGDGENLFLRDLECSNSNRCGRCDGDCDTNSQCEGNLKCFQRNDQAPVPGCRGLGVAGKDYCYKEPNNIFQQDGNNNDMTQELRLRDPQCTNNRPCTKCEGDCDSNVQCEDGLLCFQRNRDEIVPGCSGRAVRGRDYCYAPNQNQLRLRNQECSTRSPCARCEGDCDNDQQCRGNLRCFQRSGNARVPGCEGAGVRRADYCFDP